MTKITSEQKEQLSIIIENEGFDYAFMHFSEFSEIEDEKFHNLRKAYVNAAIELEEYIQE